VAIRVTDEPKKAATSLDTPEKGGRPQAPSPLPFVMAGCAVVLVGVLLFAFWPRPAPPVAMAPTMVPMTAASPTAIPPPPTPSGPDITSYVDLIEASMRAGRYREAATTAEAALRVEGLRDADRRVLTGYIVTAGMKDIYTQPSRPLDRDGQQHLVDTYLSLVERAKGAGVAIDTPLQVATSAFASSQFPLARVALEQAVADGSFTPSTERDTVKLYVSTLYGLGAWYTTAQEDSPLYKEGIRWLVTSDRVADFYETGQSEAEAKLGEAGLTDPATWPTPFETPLLP
jgi:hypothetical protein